MSTSAEDRGRLELAMAGTRLGLWDWDMVTGETVFNERWAEIIGYTLEELEPTSIETWMSFAHPDDLEASNAAINEHIAGRAPYYDIEARMRHRDGHWVWVHDRGRIVEWTSDGQPARMVGTHEDISDKQAMVEALQASERRFSTMFESHASIMLLIDPVTGSIVDANTAAADFYGMEASELATMSITDLEAGDLSAVTRPTEVADLLPDAEFVAHRRGDGSTRMVEVHSSPLTVDGRALQFLIVHDVTEREAYARQVREASTVFEHALEGIVLVDRAGLISAVNPAFVTLTDWLPDEVIGRPLTFLEAATSITPAAEDLDDVLGEERGYRGQHRLWCADGSFRDVLLSLNPVRDAEGQVSSWVAQMADLGERIRAEEARLESVLHYDRITGLPNRDLFLNRLAVELRSLRQSGQTSACLLLNLDDFKRVNEAFGFDTGEEVVRQISERLQTVIRPGDVLSRYSGDEFAILLSGLRNRAEAETITRRMLTVIDAVLVIPEVADIYVTACVGAVLLPDAIVSAEAATQRASVALQVAKGEGAGHVAFYSDDFSSGSRDRLIRLGQLRQGWLDGEFRLAYQPIWEVASGALVGAEALMRWHSPELGEVPPGTFIPLAEDVGLIEDMDAWGLEEACRQMAAWAAAGVSEPYVSVNVTAPQLAGDGFIERVKTALRENGLTPEHLTLELTESTLLHPARSTVERITELGRLGVGLAIDDFGTGYSSFAYLKQYPLDILKIDREFIAGMEEDASARSIVAAIIDLGHHLGLQVLAEGVEKPSQLEILQTLSCDRYQGFLKSPAVSPDELLELALASPTP